jgi:hypothetical protein
MRIKMDINYCKFLATLPLEIRPLSYYGSWRGIYSEPVLVFDIESDYVPISTIASFLEELTSGQPFGGYKGGEYSYTDSSPLHFESKYNECADNSIMDYLSPRSVAYLKELNYDFD